MIRATLCCISDKRRSRLYKQARFAPHFIDTRNWRSRPTFSEFLLARTKNVDDMTVPAAWRAIAVVVLAATSVRSMVDLTHFCGTPIIPKPDREYCGSCLQPVNCTGGVATPLDTCINLVCEEDLTSASCVAMEDASKCQCSSDQCDSYNYDNVDRCNNNGIYDVLDCDVVTCPVVECLCNTVTPQWEFSYPDCTKAFYCYGDGTYLLLQCEANEYVDDNGNCLPAPPEPCASGCTGLCPDNVDCSNFYYCDAGTPTQNISCPDREYFNPNANSTQVCETDPSVCARLTSCDFDGSSGGETATLTTATLTTVTTTTTEITTAAEPPPCSADTVGNTAAGPCSSSYWSCRNIGGGIYDPVPVECPDDRVFNPDPAYPYCVLRENVDTCGN